ncbi:SGNH/GDSL hydrolase family protein [Martelella lutilitoris]|uniref:SGNH/GDSL hydrolase family protein n=1 Tax=Martelella lutilitoris TaxID=2583532 RepID=A0A7T7KLC8_9HYPH|nr:SGNH/GDSL hydrolase family protein [Martelella lutilitoris]QQM30572.1 SGNH/GDSL hydrolase family protein [Martelella lutilitoris]
MRSVLCYGDSNTYGQTTANRPDDRYPHDVRWPGIVRAILGDRWLVIEEGLSGRTTVSDDPIEGAEKNGRTYLKPCIMSHKPLDLVIVMLGTNDLKIRFNKTAGEIAMGVGALVSDIKALPAGINGKVPEIMIVAPPPTAMELKEWSGVFMGAQEKSRALAAEYERIAEAQEVHFFDAGLVVSSSDADGFHLDAAAHAALGKAIAEEIEAIGWGEERARAS